MTSAPAAGIRAQDDLFGYVNGEWLATAQIPQDQSIYGAFLELRDDAEAACRELTEHAAGAPGREPGSPAQLIGDLYTSFMDTETIERAGAGPVRDHLEAVVQVSDVTGLMELLGSLRRDGMGGVLGLAVSTDSDHPESYVPFLYQSGIGLPDESYYRDEQYAAIRAKYREHVEKMLTLVGLDGPGATAESAIALEAEIAAAHWDRVRCRDRSQTHNPTERAALNELLPDELWLAWLTGLQAPDGLLAKSDVMQPSFFTAIAGLLTADRLPQWRDWLTWKVVRSAAPYSSADLVEENFDFYGRTLSGTPMLKERWKRGVALVEGAVGEALGRLYIERYFAPEAKTRMDVLVANLLQAYRKNISELSWMTADTKTRALEKLALFTPKIGFPSKFRDYAELRIEPDDLLGNVRRSEAAELDRDLAKVGTEVDREEWFMTPQTVNAYYNPGMNEIVFPAAILRPPFFDPAADDPTNYGGIGAVIGHEIGHGFDDQGSKYDGTGALKDWWTADDRAAFEQLTAKLVDQYSALSPDGADGQHVNGALTIGENIGDLGGLGISFQAWLLSLGSRTPDVAEVQSLFLNWARVWRAKTRPEEVQRRLAIDPHSPPEFRCNQVVRNLTEFYDAFDVRPGDALWLDEADRVRIW